MTKIIDFAAPYKMIKCIFLRWELVFDFRKYSDVKVGQKDSQIEKIAGKKDSWIERQLNRKKDGQKDS